MYKTARQLRISKAERESLIFVMEGLKNKTLKHTRTRRQTTKPTTLFDMSESCSGHSDCGAVACIGGWVYFHMKTKDLDARKAVPDLRYEMRNYVTSKAPASYAYHSDLRHYNTKSKSVLSRLYYPEILNKHPKYQNWSKITPAMAVKAIENVLTTGAPRWKKVAEEADAGVL